MAKRTKAIEPSTLVALALVTLAPAARAAPSAPREPTITREVVGNAQVTIGGSAPTDDGGAPILAYTVTASPGGATCSTTSALVCTIAGLENGDAYTFAVTATNVAGTG